MVIRPSVECSPGLAYVKILKGGSVANEAFVRAAYPDDAALLPAVNGTCADLADYSEPYELTDRPRVCKGGKLE